LILAGAIAAMTKQFAHFIDQLAAAELPAAAYNQYASVSSANLIRRENLRLYLQQMQGLEPKILLVGEAPGYRGCRFTGVPFSSEFILLQGLAEINLFGAWRGYQKTDECPQVWKEATATILWQVLMQLQVIPLLWNAFPFHPFQGDCLLSNRTPTRQELKIGRVFLTELIDLFQPQLIVALGNQAEITLKQMGIICPKVRHPANGGKQRFKEGLETILKSSRLQPS
jgi:hypothetical protein